MTKITALLGLAILASTAASADARDRFHFRFFAPWHNQDEYYYDSADDDVAYYEEDPSYDEDVVVVKRRPRPQPRAVLEDDDMWWLDDGARVKLEKRKVSRKPVQKVSIAKEKPVAKPKVKTVAAAPKLDSPVQTASLDKPAPVAKPKPKPIAANPVAGKTIGCTAGAAVVTGYGFADVKPKTCSGSTYAYTAARAGKIYQIKMTAASGEITDVKKVN